MTWQPYESRGVATIDTRLVERVKDYLDIKEAHLAVQILGSIHFFNEIPSISKPGYRVFIRLNESIEEFGKNVHRIDKLAQQGMSVDEWKRCVKQIEEAFWNYAEVLESCEVELFQQLDQINFDCWDTNLSRSIALIKDDLSHRMVDLAGAIRQVEEKLSVLQKVGKDRSRNIWSFIPFHKTILDKSLVPFVNQCQKFLGFRYQKFTEKYVGFSQLHTKAEEALQEIFYYRYLSLLDPDVQSRFKKIYLLLKIWEFNISAKTLSHNDIVRAFRQLSNPENTLSIFREYYLSIKKGLFDMSRMIKKKFRNVFHDQDARDPLIDTAALSRVELGMLSDVCSRYRNYLIKTDPNFNMRSRWGFSESRESKFGKQISLFLEEIQHLDILCENFRESLVKDNAMEYRPTPRMEQEVSEHLHEMTQPLASKEMMKKYAVSIVSSLQEIDELTSFYPDTVAFVRKTLCRAMRADWKYHVLNAIPEFHRLYEIHQEVIGSAGDRQHMSRLHKFRTMINEITLWVKSKETSKHTHEIELDINDIKAYLQDYFAQVQSLLRSEGQSNPDDICQVVSKIYQSLLEYRYLFSNFFYGLNPDVPEERLLRRDLLFVDQYFEAIENRLQS